MFKSPYNFDTDVSSFSTGIQLDPDADRAVQAGKDEADINNLVKTYARTGIVPGADIPSFNFEVDEIVDYQTALNRIMQADADFMSLPSGVRERFDNDPAQLLAFVHDSANRDEAIELGLVPRPEAVQPMLVRLSDIPPDVKSQTAPISES